MTTPDIKNGNGMAELAERTARELNIVSPAMKVLIESGTLIPWREITLETAPFLRYNLEYQYPDTDTFLSDRSDRDVLAGLRRRFIEALKTETDQGKDKDGSNESPDDQDLDITAGILKRSAIIPLLTAPEEQSLARTMYRSRVIKSEDSKIALAQFFSGEVVDPEPVIANRHDITVDLIEVIHEDAKDAQEVFVEANQRLVIKKARSFIGRGVELPDLISGGNLGLLRGLEKFEYWRGNKFSTYGNYWIRQNIDRIVADQGSSIRTPVHMQELMAKLGRVKREAEQELGRDVTYAEAARIAGVDEEKVMTVLRAHNVDSLSSPVSDDDDRCLEEIVGDDSGKTVSDEASYGFLRDALDLVLGRLIPEDRKAIEMRFGLNGGDEKTLEDVGKALGVTKERARQREKKALRALRQPRIKRALQDYAEI